MSLARTAWQPIDRFLQIEAASGIVLLLAALVALGLANSAWSDVYAHFWHTPVGVRLGGFTFERPLEWIVNDGLMVIFFFVVGMEIRREIHHGELSELKRAALPAAAALGGMVAPALIYLAYAGGPATRAGWGVPMATDIAFALGVIALLGRRVPAPLRVLLLALAVIDDLGAILVIAIAFSSGIHASALFWAALCLALIYVLRVFGVRSKAIYVLPAIATWAFVYASGIHPTIAGVMIGLMTPVEAWPDDASPADDLIAALHPWVAYAIMPLFALANAGVSLAGLSLDSSSSVVAVGIGIALIVGKPLGILLASAITLRLGARLPTGLTFRHLAVLGVIAGIGFTMALFIAQLAFVDPQLLAAAKLGVLASSAAAGVLGLLLGRGLLSAPVESKATPTEEPGVSARSD